MTSILKNKLCKHLKGCVLGWMWECEPILLDVYRIINRYVYIQDNLLVCMGAIYDTEQERTLLAEKIRNEKLRIQNEDKVHKTLTFTISEFSLIEQVRAKHHLKDLTQGMLFCIWNTAIEEGIETG